MINKGSKWQVQKFIWALLFGVSCIAATVTGAHADEPPDGPIDEPSSDYLFQSRYYGQVFTGDGAEASCIQELGHAMAAMERAGLIVMDGSCVDAMMGGKAVAVDYKHGFGKDVEKTVMDMEGLASCTNALPEAVRNFEAVSFNVISSTCSGSQESATLKIEYVRNSSRFINTYSEGQHFEKATECVIYVIELEGKFRKNNMGPLLSMCQAYVSGYPEEKIIHKAEIFYAGPLDQTLASVGGKVLETRTLCDADLAAVAQKFTQNGITVLQTYCAASGDSFSQFIAYLDGAISSKLEMYSGLAKATEGECQSAIVKVESQLATAGKVALYSYCSKMDERFYPTVHSMR